MSLFAGFFLLRNGLFHAAPAEDMSTLCHPSAHTLLNTTNADTTLSREPYRWLECVFGNVAASSAEILYLFLVVFLHTFQLWDQVEPCVKSLVIPVIGTVFDVLEAQPFFAPTADLTDERAVGLDTRQPLLEPSNIMLLEVLFHQGLQKERVGNGLAESKNVTEPTLAFHF